MSSIVSSIADELRAKLGTDAVDECNDVLHVTPADTEGVSQVMSVAFREGLVVTPKGGGTKQHWGNPVAPQMLLDLRRLADIREHVWQDLTATVGAGTTWAEMQAALGKHGQRVALDPLFPERATVGGVIATNDSGPLRLRYGSMRDLVIGMTVVLADGTIARSGGKVVKNVAGYDLPKLLIGSFGTLAVVTEVSFRLHPAPAHKLSLTVHAADALQLLELMKTALAASLSIERMQLRNEPNAFALDIELASAPEVLREQEDRLRGLAGALPVEAAAGDVWSARERLVIAPQATVLKITALPAKIGALIAGFAQLSQADGQSFRAVADAAGVVTVACEAPVELLTGVVQDLRERLRASGGMVVVLEAGSLPAEIDRWGGVPSALEVMRTVKQEFDPRRVLNPGKFVGGL